MTKLREGGLAQARAAVEGLLQSDENQLYEQIALRAQAIAEDPAAAGSFDLMVTFEGTEMGLKEDAVAFGKRLFRRWNVEANKLICGSEAADEKDRSDIVRAFGIGKTEVAAILAGLLVAQLAVSPAIAAVIAALAVKRFLQPTYDEFCKTWKSCLPKI